MEIVSADDHLDEKGRLRLFRFGRSADRRYLQLRCGNGANLRRVRFLSRPAGTRMLAKRRALKLNRREVERTPLLIPSFSSKGFPDIDDIIKYSSELIDGVTLSALRSAAQTVSDEGAGSHLVPY